jgi:CMP/dCMP kinase
MSTQALNSVETGPSRTVLIELQPAATDNNVFRLDAPIIITIDGPAGTGKSSVARALAKRLGLDFLDTGAMYRAAAAIAIDYGVPMTDPKRLVDMVKQADLHFNWALDPPQILAWGRSMSARIREPDVTAIVSPVAGIGDLRQHMVAKQRIIGRQHPRLVSEGRDQGSVVFPDAHVKFYLDASAQVRAARRAQQLRASGVPADEMQLFREIEERDRSDMSRNDGPLVRPPGGIVVDTSHLLFDEVVSELETIVRQKAEEP